MFEKDFRLLSFVERWAIAPRHSHQSVDSHSFFVCLYSLQLCEMLGVPLADQALVARFALCHDAIEVWSSDIPGPAKRSLLDEDKAKAYQEQFAATMGDWYRASINYKKEQVEIHGRVLVPVSAIIRLADRIDELMFIKIEEALGNRMVVSLGDKIRIRLREAAKLLAGERFATDLLAMLDDQIYRIIMEGATVPSNDSDLQK